MSTPEQPLTRKQMRELGRTGSVPVQSDGATPADDAGSGPSGSPAPQPAAPAGSAASPAAAPVVVPDSEVDLDVIPLTRRQAREQERVRTASVPVITAEMMDAHHAAADSAAELADRTTGVEQRTAETDDAHAPAGEEPVPAASASQAPDAEPAQGERDIAAEWSVPAPAAAVPAQVQASNDLSLEWSAAAPADAEAGPDQGPEDVELEWNAPGAGDTAAPGHGAGGALDWSPPASAVTVGPQFGAALLTGGEVTAAPLPPSFDELIARGSTSTGTLATPSALILSQTPSAPPLSGPVNATGEVLITGSYQLPEGLGSAGGDPRATDGKDVDAVLIDGELPASSSPTPIAASAAVSTVRGTGEIIRPPAPEKGSRLLFTLAITAGVLALALVGVLIVAVVNGAL